MSLHADETSIIVNSQQSIMLSSAGNIVVMKLHCGLIYKSDYYNNILFMLIVHFFNLLVI